MYSSLFPKQGDQNAKRTEHIDKEQGNTKHEASRSVNYRATQNKNNIGTTALEWSVVYTTAGFKGLSLYKLHFKNAWIQCRVDSLMPYECNFRMSFEWLTLSKAFEKSSKIKSVCLPWLDLRARSSTREANCVSQERISLKPCCRSYIRQLVSRCFARFEAMMCSITLHKIHVREICR